MSQVYITLPLFVLFSVRLVYGFPGDNVMLMPQFEVRNVDPYLTRPSQPYPTQFQANRNPQQVFNDNVMHRKQAQVPVAEKQSNQNMTFGEFMKVLNEASQSPVHTDKDLQRLRTETGRDDIDNPAYSTLPRPVGYSRPNYAAPATYHQPASLVPPSSEQPKTPLLKPDLRFSGLLGPAAAATTKVANKSSGLLSLVLSLFSGSSSGLQLTGLKELLIDGIIKPLLVAKGGLKLLISKLTIPVIALLLINLEVLITVWWLWEDCPQAKPYSPEPVPTPSYEPKPTSYSSNYNSYR